MFNKSLIASTDFRTSSSNDSWVRLAAWTYACKWLFCDISESTPNKFAFIVGLRFNVLATDGLFPEKSLGARQKFRRKSKRLLSVWLHTCFGFLSCIVIEFWGYIIHLFTLSTKCLAMWSAAGTKSRLRSTGIGTFAVVKGPMAFIMSW